MESKGNDISLFIADALNNLDLAEEMIPGIRDVLIFKSNIDQVLGCYPFKNLRATSNLLFLNGIYDIVIAKQTVVSFYHPYFLHICNSGCLC